MLKASFTRAEREFLNSQPTFVSQAEKATTADDYQKLCEFSEELLREQQRAKAREQQIRRDPPGNS